jgi:exonuclease VII large subunit
MSGKAGYGGIYCCYNFEHKGKCDRNTVTQNELLDNVIQAIQEKLLNNGTLDRLKDAIRRKLEADTPKVNVEKLRKELSELETKIDKARRRLVEVDSDMVGEVQSHLRGLREQREQLEATLKQAGTPRSQQRSEIEGMVDSIFAGVFRLRDAIKKGDPATVREMLRCAVERIDLWSEKQRDGKRHLYQFKRGVIQLRGIELNNLSVLSKRYSLFRFL